ncbi:MAG: flagellar hook-associated protein FlgK [Desulfobacterales bacterium]|nr:flagellar hook-associated protein FlgK [Desulfobacterales bacterium]
MPGIPLTLSIARSAIAAQQYGLSVSGHNVSNVNNPDYSRQIVQYTTKGSYRYSHYILGDGVNMDQVQRSTDQMIETHLSNSKSSLASFEASQTYMKTVENIFNENEDSSISAILSQFWNTWHDLSNNPEGGSERIGVYDNAVRLSSEMSNLNLSLSDMKQELMNEINLSIDQINSISEQISKINEVIPGLEVSGRSANDQRDQVNGLINKLAQLVNVQSFQQSNGTISVSTANGFLLVTGNEHFNLQMKGNNIEWVGSNGKNAFDITQKLSGGKIAGWMKMHNEIVPKFQADFNSLAKELIWDVNRTHSQGVGLDLFADPLKGKYKTDENGMFSTLTYGDKIDYTKDFKMWISDKSKLNPVKTSVEVDLGISDGVEISGNSGHANEKYIFTVIESGIAGQVNSPKIAWERYRSDGTFTGANGVISLDQGAGAYQIEGDVSLVVSDNAKTFIAGNTLTMNTANSDQGEPADLMITSSSRANSSQDTYVFKVKTPQGEIGKNPIEIDWSSNFKSGTITLPAEYPYEPPVDVTVDGMALRFSNGNLYSGDVFTIKTDAEGDPTLQKASDWHWTLDSFKTQLEREMSYAGVSGVTPLITDDHALMFIPTSSQYIFGFGVDDSDHLIRSDHGISGFPIEIGTNNEVNFYEDVGRGYNEMRTAYIPQGTYESGEDLANAVEDAMNAASNHSILYKANFDEANRKFIIEEETPKKLIAMKMDWNTTNSAGSAMGYIYNDEYITSKEIDMPKQDNNSGLLAALGINTFFTGQDASTIKVHEMMADKNNIAASKIDPTGNYGYGDNSNALEMTDIQYNTKTFYHWQYDVHGIGQSNAINVSFEEYYQGMIGSLGIESSDIARGLDFNQVMVEKLNEQRFSVAGVSLDEEMVNIMKFQHAFTVASKLLKIADEMLNTIVEMR